MFRSVRRLLHILGLGQNVHDVMVGCLVSIEHSLTYIPRSQCCYRKAQALQLILGADAHRLGWLKVRGDLTRSAIAKFRGKSHSECVILGLSQIDSAATAVVPRPSPKAYVIE